MTDTTASTAAPEGPSNEDIEQAILSMDVMDMPSRHEFVGNAAMLKPATKVTALAPEHREGILQELANVSPEHREAREAELVQAKVAELARGHRLYTGPGDGAPEYHKVGWEISREITELESQMQGILDKLSEVVHIDPVTEVKTFRYPPESARFNALIGDLKMLDHQVNALRGPVGERRLKAAMEKSIADERARRAELEDAAEVERRAKHMAREASINARAASKARFLNPELKV